jgi:hypothetical protein
VLRNLCRNAVGRAIRRKGTVFALLVWLLPTTLGVSPSFSQTRDELFHAALDETNGGCPSLRGRELFEIAAAAGDEIAALWAARSHDPLQCPDAPGQVDAAEAARRYRALAELGEPEGVLQWAALVEARLVEPTPFGNLAAILTHYGVRLLGVDSSTANSMLRRAYALGDDAAFDVLQRHASSLGPSDWGYSAALCELGEALLERFTDGERDQDALTTFRNCGSEFRLVDLLQTRVETGRASRAEQLELLALYVSASDDYDEVLIGPELVATAMAEGGTPDERLLAVRWLYSRVSYASGDFQAWMAQIGDLEAALQTDSSQERLLRFADHVYKFAAERLPGDADLAWFTARDNLFARVAIEYGAQRQSLDANRISILANLTWRGLGPSPQTAAKDLFRRAASLGDDAARNTSAMLEPAFFPTGADPFLGGTDDVCKPENIRLAVERQSDAYSDLILSRGGPERDFLVALNRYDLSIYDAIPQGTAVLLYAHGGYKHCVFVLDADGLRAFESVYAPDGFFSNVIGAWIRASGIDAEQRSRSAVPLKPATTKSQPSPLDIDEEALLKVASRFLFPGEVAEVIEHYERLVVVPYDDIGVVPFPAIPLGNQQLVDVAAVTIAPGIIDLFAANIPGQRAFLRWSPGCGESVDQESGGFIDRLEEAPEIQPQPMTDIRLPLSSALIVGDPVYRDAEFRMPQLVGARAEAESIGSLLSSRVLIGEQATLAAINERASESGLLYFATHGVSYETTGLGGFIALANGDRWTAQAVQQSCLTQARLTVLSACQTGLGQKTAGGVIGLARGFQIAGVPEVIMSLWNVNDAATEALMVGAMSRIKAGDVPAVALRQAMLKLRETRPHPKYWASFAVFSELMN